MRPSLRDSSIAVICAVLINAVIFLSIPFLNTVREQEAKKSYMGTPVTVSYQAEKSANKPEDSEPDQKPEPAQSVQPRPSPRPPALSERQPEAPETRSDLDLPEPNFELPDADIGSVAVSAPETRAPKQPSSGREGLSMREVDRKPRVVSRIQPRYPHRARQREITGKVVLKFLVDKDGEVERVSVVSADPEGVFEDNAVSAVKKWRFEPGRVEGEPVPTWVRLPVSFTLSD